MLRIIGTGWLKPLNMKTERGKKEERSCRDAESKKETESNQRQSWLNVRVRVRDLVMIQTKDMTIPEEVICSLHHINWINPTQKHNKHNSISSLSLCTHKSVCEASYPLTGVQAKLYFRVSTKATLTATLEHTRVAVEPHNSHTRTTVVSH